MDPITAIAVATAAFEIAEKMAPHIKAAFERGEITAQQQAEILAKYESLQKNFAANFSAPHWQKSPV